MTGIFAGRSSLWTKYRARLQFRGKCMGGVPKDPKLIEGWLRAKAGINDVEELQMALVRTMNERGAEVGPEMNYEELVKASEQIAGSRETSGFKRDSRYGLYLESRQLKSALREAVNILYAGDRWGVTKKSPKSFFVERVFPTPDQVYLGRREQDGTDMVLGHVTGPQGPRSTLGYHEYVQQAEITFDVLVARDAIQAEHWPDIWTLMEENGLGALRSQGYGKFDVLAWDKIDPHTPPPDPPVLAAAVNGRQPSRV